MQGISEDGGVKEMRGKKLYPEMRDQDMMDEIGMSKLPLIIYRLFQKYKGHCEMIDIGGDCMFRFGETNVANVSYLAVYIHFLEIEKHHMRIEGNVSWPTVLLKHFSFYISVNGEKKNCRMFDIGMDKKVEGKTYESCTAFLYEQELDVGTDYEIKFLYCCNGIVCESGKINSMRFVPVADVLENQYAYRDSWIVSIEKNRLYIRNFPERDAKEFETQFMKAAANHMKQKELHYVQSIRKEYFKRKCQKKKPIWLFFDRLDKADDNGEAFFEHACRFIKKRAECYFIISKISPDYNRLKKIGTVVEAFSKEHCVLLLLADYIFTSQLNGWIENPFGRLEEYFRDLYHQAKIVFMQHGVTKDDQTLWLNRYNQNLYAIVTSAEKEQTAFLKYPYFYDVKQIWDTGMPRMDRLYQDDKKYILFMPTWRRGLMEQRFDEKEGVYRWFLKEEFRESKYYQAYHGIMNHRGFLDVCKEKGYRVLFMPHPIMQPFAEYFEVSEEIVRLPYSTRWRELFAQSSLMVTDYSSVAFDYAYLKKPVIYWQFDKEEFQKMHTYHPGYFDYQRMGFGEVVITQKQLIRIIERYLNNGCREKKKYRKRCEKFYKNIDKKNSERLFRKVLREECILSL